MGIPFSKVSLENDWKAPKDRRKAYYNQDSINSITIGKNFFFNGLYEKPKQEIKRSSDNTKLYTLKNDITLSDSQIIEKSNQLTLLEYLTKKFNSDIYMSCHQTVTVDHIDRVVRAKQKISIEKLDGNEFRVEFHDIYFNEFNS